MKSLLMWLAAVGLLASLMTAPGRTQVIIEDHCTGEGIIGVPDTVGTLSWMMQAGGTIPLVDGRAIFDPSVNNPTVILDPDTGEEIDVGVTVYVLQRFLAPFLQIPPASSGRMLQLSVEVMDRGAE